METAAPSPLGALDELASRTGAEFPHLAAARALTAERLTTLRSRLAEGPPASLLGEEEAVRHAVVLFGSWGRSEPTRESDDDWALVVPGAAPPESESRQLLGWVGDAIGAGIAAPGEQGTFGEVVSATSLSRHIGLEDDTNKNLTRRMLLLLESLAATGEEVWATAVRAVLDAYLDPAADQGDYAPPRFLLNDLVRYWRTICVDFEGKHRAAGASDDKWVLRNAKLRLSRKMLFAGGLVPVLKCRERTAEAMGDFLAAQLAAPPTDRLAAAFLAAEATGGLDIGARALGAYDAWLGILADPERRAELRSLTRLTRDDSATWREVRDLGIRLEQGLLALLFQTELAPVAQRYLVF